MKRLSIDIPNELHHLLKVHTSYTGCKIKDFVAMAIKNGINTEQKPRISKNIPNAETIKALEESTKGIGITEFDSKEDFFKHLDQLYIETQQEIAESNK